MNTKTQIDFENRTISYTGTVQYKQILQNEEKQRLRLTILTTDWTTEKFIIDESDTIPADMLETITEGDRINLLLKFGLDDQRNFIRDIMSLTILEN